MTAPKDKNQGTDYIVDSLYHGHEAMTGLPHHEVPNRAYNQVRASNVDLLYTLHNTIWFGGFVTYKQGYNVKR